MNSPTGLGIQYYSDDGHFRSKDLDLWIPELRSMGLSWLAIKAGSHAPFRRNF